MWGNDVSNWWAWIPGSYSNGAVHPHHFKGGSPGSRPRAGIRAWETTPLQPRASCVRICCCCSGGRHSTMRSMVLRSAMVCSVEKHQMAGLGGA